MIPDGLQLGVRVLPGAKPGTEPHPVVLREPPQSCRRRAYWWWRRWRNGGRRRHVARRLVEPTPMVPLVDVVQEEGGGGCTVGAEEAFVGGCHFDCCLEGFRWWI